MSKSISPKTGKARGNGSKDGTDEANGQSVQNLPTAAYGSPDKPLVLGDYQISCYVLDDGRRVLAQRGLQVSLGMSTSGGSSGAHRMARFVGSIGSKGIQINDLALRIQNPIRFSAPGIREAYGYEATILPEICDAVLQARTEGKLQSQQSHIAKQCEILVRSFAKVGIIALVDEATGYQDARSRDALAKILEEFIAKELSSTLSLGPSAAQSAVVQ